MPASEPSPPLTPRSEPAGPSQEDPDVSESDLSAWGIVEVPFRKQTAIPIVRGGLRTSAFPTNASTVNNEAPESGGITEPGISTHHAFLRGLRYRYRYQRIRKDQIRLLIIKPGAEDDQISVTLQTFSRKSKIPYVALSYNWGDGAPDQIIIAQNEIQANGIKRIDDLTLHLTEGAKKIAVRQNLHAALKHLRREDIKVTVWADALCINQDDTDEKSEQIGQMPSIYRNASHVCVWLGIEEGSSTVSAMAMKFIPEVINPQKHDSLLNDDKMVPYWASLFELLEWSWFSRRWIVQEIALARNATVHCGNNPEINWIDFQDAIAIFCRDFTVLRPKLRLYFQNRYPERPRWRSQSDWDFHIEQLGAKRLVDVTTDLFRESVNDNGLPESTYSLEKLVCVLSSFDASDPRDTINAFINISSELVRKDPDLDLALPVIDYKKPVFYAYRDFVRGVVARSKSLDIICRHWALPAPENEPSLPSYIKSAKDSEFGTGYEVFEGRKGGESLVGLPGHSPYHASGRGYEQKHPDVTWSHIDVTMSVTGLAIGCVSFRTDPFPDGVITKPCLERLGWSFKTRQTQVSEVPSQLWQTLVASRGPQGAAMPTFYRRACQHVMANHTLNGHIKLDSLLSSSVTGHVKDYLERVRVVTWNRLFVEADVLPGPSDVSGLTGDSTRKLVGLGPPEAQERDIIAILYGCSVPVILRPEYLDGKCVGYRFVGEAFVYGHMDGEAFRGGHETSTFNLI